MTTELPKKTEKRVKNSTEYLQKFSAVAWDVSVDVMILLTNKGEVY